MTPEQRQALIQKIKAVKAERQADTPTDDAMDVAKEFGAAALRGAGDVADIATFFPRTGLNLAMEAMGSKNRLMAPGDVIDERLPGNYMDPGVGRTAVQFAGENLPMAAGGAKVLATGYGAAKGLMNKTMQALGRGAERVAAKVGGSSAAATAAKPRVRVPAGTAANAGREGVQDIAAADATVKGLTVNNPLGRYGLSRAVKAMTGSPTLGAIAYTGSHPATRRAFKALKERIKDGKGAN